MKVLYILKHFPCLSQTFVLNEILALRSKGIEVWVLAAIDLEETLVHKQFTDHRLAEKTIYLNHDYLYPYAPTGKLSAKAVKSKYFHAMVWPIPGISYSRKRRLATILNGLESSAELKQRAFLETVFIKRLIDRKGISHVHCPFGEDNVKIAFILSRVFNIPYTFKMHAYDIFQEHRSDLPTLSKYALKLITISDFNKKWLHKYFHIPLERIRVIRDGIPLESIKPVKKYYPKPFKILSICRLSEKKGLPFLVEACAILKDMNKEFVCEIYGSGPLEEMLRCQIHTLQLGDFVQLKGPVTQEEVYERMSTASVFVLPSIRTEQGDMDGTPNSLMEAMARGIPVISTRISGIPEIIDEEINGVLVNPKDARTLAVAILRFYAPGEWSEKMRKNGRLKIREKYNLKKNTEQFIQLIRQ